MILSDVKETHVVTEKNHESGEETTSVEERSMSMLFVRGDMIILVSQPMRTKHDK